MAVTDETDGDAPVAKALFDPGTHFGVRLGGHAYRMKHEWAIRIISHLWPTGINPLSRRLKHIICFTNQLLSFISHAIIEIQ